MPNVRPIFKSILEAVEAAKKPHIELPAKPPIVERAPGAPFPGPAPVREAVRATENRAAETTGEKIMGIRKLMESFVRPDPGVSKPVEETMFKGRWRSRAAQDVADLDLSDWYSPLQKDPINQNTLISDYMTAADEIAQAERYGKDRIRDIHIDLWKNTLNKLQEQVDADPEVQQAITKIRSGLDEQFEDMAARGWIAQDRYLNDYTPIRRLNATVQALAGYIGEDPDAMKSRILAQQMKRQGGSAPRETDLPALLRGVRQEYLSKVAEHEAFLDLLSNPEVNLTEKFIMQDGRISEHLPTNLRVVRPGPGMFGATLRTPEGSFLDASLKALDPSGRVNVGGYVFPEAVADAVANFHPRQPKGLEKSVYGHAMSLMKNLTVYNPRNTNVNRVGDLLTSMFFPGEGKAQPVGILRWMGKANEAGYKGAFNKGRVIVELHGKKVDLFDQAVRDGLTSGTLAEHLAGTDMALPPELARLYPHVDANRANWLDSAKRTLQADRLATEVAPRIAAGLEAVERTGDWAQFGKVGRDITFRYGAGAPRAANFPIVKMMDPFIQYMGLATQRFLEMSNAKAAGPKARVLLGLSAVPFAMWKWNTQNDSYKQVEDSLARAERNLPHIILGSFDDPGVPQRDVDGNPVVLRFKYLIPEQVAAMAGLAQAPGRAARVLQGRDTPMQFVKDTGEQAKKSVGDMLVLPTMLKEAISGKSDLTGKEMSPTDWVNRVLPISRIGTKAVERGQTYGPAEGAKTLVTETTGASFIKGRHKGAALLDADVKDAERVLNDAKASLRWSMKNGTPKQVREAREKVTKAQAERARLMKAVREERAQGYKPPAPNIAAHKTRMQANREAAQEK